jgi:hypothetical protein
LDSEILKQAIEESKKKVLKSVKNEVSNITIKNEIEMKPVKIEVNEEKDLHILNSINNDFKSLVKQNTIKHDLLNRKTQSTIKHEDYLNDKEFDKKDLIVREELPETEIYERVRRNQLQCLYVKLINVIQGDDYWANKVILPNLGIIYIKGSSIRLPHYLYTKQTGSISSKIFPFEG